MADNSEKIVCLRCNLSFTKRKSLYRHTRHFHPNEEALQPKYKGPQCAICQTYCSSIKNLHDHIKADHPDIKLSFQSLLFYSHSDFEDWKTKIQHETQSLFISNRKDAQLADGRSVTYFYCHRSGQYDPKKDRERSLKLNGSNKTGFACPAHITVYKEVHEEVFELSVQYQSVHVGHECEISRIPLTEEEKQEIATSLQRGVSKTCILSGLKETVSQTRRISHTTRIDLNNICRQYNINQKRMSEKFNIISVDDLNAADNSDHETAATEEENLTESLKVNVSKPSEVQSEQEEVRASVISDLKSLILICQTCDLSLNELKTLKYSISVLKSNLKNDKQLPAVSDGNGAEQTNNSVVYHVVSTNDGKKFKLFCE